MTPSELQAENERLKAERDSLSHQLEADRTIVADAVANLRKELDSRHWLTEGRGSYEWNDDRYREEFFLAGRALIAAMEPLVKVAANWAGCPRTTAEVAQARIDKDTRIAALEAERDALDAQCQSLLGGVVKAEDIERERDEARAQAARLAEVLRSNGSCYRCGGNGKATFSGFNPPRIEDPCQLCKGDGLREDAREVLSSTESLAWLQSKIDEATAMSQSRIARLAERINYLQAFIGFLPACPERIRNENKALLASTDALAWLREQIALRLERLVEEMKRDRTTLPEQHKWGWDCAVTYVEDAVAELRREEGA